MLHFRILMSKNICPGCKDVSESSVHVVHDCVLATQIWNRLNYYWLVAVAKLCLIEWLKWMLENVTSDRKVEIAITIWLLWFSQNIYIHE